MLHGKNLSKFNFIVMIKNSKFITGITVMSKKKVGPYLRQCSTVHNSKSSINCYEIIIIITRMVQLPATAAIEYVAAVNACLIYIISSV